MSERSLNGADGVERKIPTRREARPERVTKSATWAGVQGKCRHPDDHYS
jgi:hypothetical protein